MATGPYHKWLGIVPPEVSDHQRRPHIAHIKEGKIFILYNS
jgi:hypothetical protein